MKLIRQFLKLESAGGLVLLIMTIAALVINNTPWVNYYEKIFKVPLEIQLGQFSFEKPLLFWINEGLMTLFFFLIGLELKREYIEGELSDIKKTILPAVAALGGMIVPALIYILFNWGHSIALAGWPIPVATDIAFAVGVLSFFGSRVPHALKLFLLMLAIFDDIGAIVIIAFFPGHGVSFIPVLLMTMTLFVLGIMHFFRVQWLSIYLILGVLLWCFTYFSGIHPTIAGVLLAFTLPLKSNQPLSPLRRMETFLHPWVAFAIVPLFAFANAGISFSHVSWKIFLDAATLGIIGGLFLGKQLGVLGSVWLMIKLGIAQLPTNTRWPAFYGVSLLCGIGFTMSLFLGTLAFQSEPDYLVNVRLGVLAGSFLSGALGALVLYTVLNKKD